MKLGQILAIAGCKLVPNGSAVNVTKDGTVVMSGSIDEIRERVAFNCHHHDDPIYYGRPRLSKSDNGKTPATQAKIEAAGRLINKAIDAELPEHSDEKTKSDGRGNRGGSAGADKPSNTQKVFPRACIGQKNGARQEKKIRYILPDNRVGALQEMYHTEHRSYHTGVIPRYEFSDKPVPPGEHHHCSVRLGELLCRGKGLTKKLAKQDAAGIMLLDIMHGKDPFAGEGPVPKAKPSVPKYKPTFFGKRGTAPVAERGDAPVANWEENYLRKHHAALRYPTNMATFRYNRNADGWLLRKPKKTKYILRSRPERGMDVPN